MECNSEYRITSNLGPIPQRCYGNLAVFSRSSDIAGKYRSRFSGYAKLSGLTSINSPIGLLVNVTGGMDYFRFVWNGGASFDAGTIPHGGLMPQTLERLAKIEIQIDTMLDMLRRRDTEIHAVRRGRACPKMETLLSWIKSGEMAHLVLVNG